MHVQSSWLYQAIDNYHDGNYGSAGQKSLVEKEQKQDKIEELEPN
jgi:hypothetical protein